jgi:hypothetical protein
MNGSVGISYCAFVSTAVRTGKYCKREGGINVLASCSVRTQKSHRCGNLGLCVLVAVNVVVVHQWHSSKLAVLETSVCLLLQAGGSWRSKLAEPQPDDDRRGMRLAYLGRSPHPLYDSLQRNMFCVKLFTVLTWLWHDLFLIFHCAKLLISFKLVLFVGGLL